MERSRPVILFDGVCNFCNRMVNFAIRNDKKGKLRFAALQSAAGARLREEYRIDTGIDTVILVDNGKVYTYARAAIRICRYLDWPARLLYGFIIVPPFISQPVYKWFAKRRYKWFGKKETCMVPDAAVRSRFLA